jgi:uncharacterized lipoprotein
VLKFSYIVIALVALVSLSGCSSGPDTSTQKYNRAGRPYKEVRGMSSHQVDRSTLYNNCLKERDASYCNNRLGR